MAVAALLLLARGAFAQNWSTVDDFQYSSGTNAYATGLAKDPTGTVIYAAGDGVDASGVYHAVAMQSSDGGNSWSLMDDYLDPASPPGDGFGYDAGIATDPFGNIYASGYGPSTSGTIWFTRRSTDGGVTWLTVDHALLNATPGALAADTAGNIYVVGMTLNGTWIVRKGTGGSSWATVDQFSGQSSTQVSSHPFGVFCHPTAGVFVVGSSSVHIKNGRLGTYAPGWTVRRSRDGGATWATVDLDLAGFSGARGVAADARGNIYVVGSTSVAYKSGTYQSWLVRKSADGGNSWVQVESYQPSPAVSTRANAVACDASGNLFVAGVSGNQWLVRESAAGTGSFTNVDTFQYVPGQYSEPSTVMGYNANHAFVAGSGNDATGVQHWIVRKR